MSERGVWVIRGGELIPRHLAPPLNVKFGSGPMIIADGMSDTWNPANGKTYDSKSAYYRDVKRAGLEIIGNERNYASPKKELPPVEQDVATALAQIEAKAPRLPRKKGKRRGI